MCAHTYWIIRFLIMLRPGPIVDSFRKKKKKDISSAFISFYFVLFVCLRRMFAEVCACVRPRAVCACVHLMHILICQQCFFCVCVCPGFVMGLEGNLVF